MNNKMIEAGKYRSHPPLKPRGAEPCARNLPSRGGLYAMLAGSALLATLCLGNIVPSALPLLSLVLQALTAATGPFVLPLVLDPNGGTLGMFLLALIGTGAVAHLWRRAVSYTATRNLLACLLWTGSGALLMQPIFA